MSATPHAPRPTLCALCRTAPAVGVKSSRLAQAKARYCAACRATRRRRPSSGVTPEQAAQLRPLLGQMSYPEIQRRLGLSNAAIVRWCWEESVTHPFWNAYRPEVVVAVLAAYEAAPAGQGTRRVQEQFPDVHVRSIVGRHRLARPRQTRWTGAQLFEAARMAGLVSPNAQARYFGRPHASDGSIKALWVKRFQCPARDVNGLAAHTAWPLCGPGTPAVLVRHPQTSAPSMKILWMDLAEHLRPEVAAPLREAVEALAAFQRWLQGTRAREAIMTMIREREQDAGSRDHERDASAPATRRAD